MPPKRKGVVNSNAAAAEEPQTKRHHSESVTLPEEIVVEIISHLPLPQIFSLHTLSKSINNALKDSTQTLWKRLVKQHWRKDPHNNDPWNESIEYGEENEKFKDEKAPYSSVMGTFCWGKKPTVEAEQQWIEEASNEKCKLLVQTWAIIEIWNKALSPLYYPNSTANMEPVMSPFYLWPDDSHPFFKHLTKTISKDCDAEATETPLTDFHKDAIETIKDMFREKAEEEADEEEEDEEEGGKKEKKDKEPEFGNFPRGSKAKWEQFPKLFWENAKWTTMENPFISWQGGEFGPWDTLNKLFWGQRKDNSVVGFIAIVDNC